MEEFMDIYKNETCLWKVKCKEYHDRSKKDAAYSKLIYYKLKEMNSDEHTTESTELNSQSDTPPNSIHTDTSEQETTPTSTWSSPRKRSSSTLGDEVLLCVEDHFKRHQCNGDRFDVFGKLVGMKLRDLPNNQRILAEKIINETLFLAEMGQLTLSHRVHTNEY
ncbi:hypothetical protein ANN_14787 [Periplaneta americana]|uniref:MADF domain-containing protein n=1 Tax=Periplaneta americana TaxID=6978 RepID=A0ABQ8SXA0_PERAM|nr:hypothetical protein ANN_14787 [Periplaneta americana]